MEFTLTDDQEWLRPELNTNWLFAQTSVKSKKLCLLSNILTRKDYQKYANRVLDFHIVLHEFYKWCKGSY